MGLMSTIAIGLGISLDSSPDEASAKGGKKKKKNNKHKNQFRCNGRWMDKCVGGQILDDDICQCVCPSGSGFNPKCKKCLKFGVECCPNEAPCPVAETGCCNTAAGEKCTQIDGCCNTLLENFVCASKWCCSKGQRCCPNEGCKPQNQACCTTPCSSDPAGCCGAGKKCCPISGCRPEEEECCGVGEVMCGGIKCCAAGTTCTTGTNNGVPRAACCDPGEFPCDGVCCVAGHCGCCRPDYQNPCLCC